VHVTVDAMATSGTWDWVVANGVPDDIHAEDRSRVAAMLAHPGDVVFRAMVITPTAEIRTREFSGQVGELSAHGTWRDVTDEVIRDTRVQFYKDVFASVQIGVSAWRRMPTGLVRVASNPAFDRMVGTGFQLSPELVARSYVVTAPTKAAPFSIGTTIVEPTVFPLPADHVGITLEDVTTRQRNMLIEAAERRALELLAAGAELRGIFDVIIRAMEELDPDSLGSILLLDESGTRVQHGASARLPREYTSKIDGTPIGPAAGACGTALFRREPVISSDIETDPLWLDYRVIARAFGLRACWSWPILASDGRALGTFAIYHRYVAVPDEVACELMRRASHVTGIVIERRALDEQLRAFAARLDAIREDERTSIARDIHDQLGQALTALKLDVGWLERRVSEPALTAKLAEMGRATDDILRTVRRVSADLRPGILDAIGLAAAIEWQAEEFQRTTGTVVRVRAEIGDLRLDRDLATTVFRIFQESLTNISRHARAHEVEVALTRDQSKLRLEVTDDGVGIPDVKPSRTLGLLGMHERARSLGGECTIRRRNQRGTVVSLTVPLRFPGELTG